LSARVSISRGAALWFLDLAEATPAARNNPDCPPRYLADLRAALKPKRSVVAAAKVRRAKKATKRDAFAAIRGAVVKRADGNCEACFRSLSELDRGEADHFWGRVRTPTTCQNVWLLCFSCHREKTANKPSPDFWLASFEQHVSRYGYTAERLKARNRMTVLEMMARQQAVAR
jgi:5-methylcytosine-specific restriction endonuclease McrA